MSNLATLRRDGPVATLTINRPDARNALSIELLAALHDRLDELERTPAPVTVLTGEGRAFCAGMDLKQVLGGYDTAFELLSSLGALTLRLRSLPSVVVAKVNGAAIGGGCGLVCVCDIALSHEHAKLGFPEVELGLCPAVVAPWVVRKIGPGRARRVLLLGGVMDGTRAAEAGLIDILTPTTDDLDAETDALTERLASGGPEAMAVTKSLLNRIDGSDDRDLITEGARLSAKMVSEPEAQARLKARFG